MHFWDQLDLFGDRTALIDSNGREWSYREIIEAADSMMEGWTGRHLLLLEMANRSDAIIAYIAALRAGWPVLIVSEADEAAATRMVEVFRPAVRWRAKDGFVATEVNGPTTDLHPDLAVLLSTSGTTGSTKLVRLSACAVDANARSIGDYLGLSPDERAITTLPPSYSYGLSVLNSHLAAGATLVLNDASVIEASFRDLVDRHSATSFAGVPYTYELLERSGFLNALPASIRTMTQAGGRMPTDRVERVAVLARAHGARLFVMYGQTEATARMAWLPPERLPELAGCIGQAIPGGRFDLVDPETGAPTEGAGELLYSGPNVMMGYGEETGDLARGQELESLRTGDLAEEVEPGIFRITGRKNRFIKMFGLRLSLDEIEREAARLGYPIAATGTDEILVLASEHPMPDNRLISRIAERYHLPEAQMVHFPYERLPRLASGKVDYRTLTQAAKRSASASEAGAQSDPLDAVRAVFRRSFPTRTIADDDSFLSLEGDSLTYINFVLGLEALLGPLPQDWQMLTVAQLATLAQPGLQPETIVTVEPNVFVRAAAPIMVVCSHAGIDALSGGAALLMIAAGQSFGKFGYGDLAAGRPGKVLRSFLLSVLIPYWLILIGYQATRGGLNLPDILLINNFVPQRGPKPFETWFVQALFQAILLVIALSLIPSVRNLLRQRPSSATLALLVFAAIIGLVHRFFLMDVLSNHGEEMTYVFWLFALGLAAQFVETPRARLTALALACIMAVAIYGDDRSRMVSVGLGAIFLLWNRRIPVPRLLLPVLTLIGSASLFIYMMHGRAPVHSMTADWPIDIIRIGSGVLLGVAAYLAYDWVALRVRRILSERRGPRMRPS
ncbi:AMP-binding protein [Sphingobium sp. SYK-6]|uniref:AMP-binding protein n=1 Tax=Sphingobium sp. (strain NBRC 103272 / SYK-6) TaxID=627192 RepID=UPI0003046718|nr:AMP-binding protein [Sphingobium sp. SYK-6]